MEDFNQLCNRFSKRENLKESEQEETWKPAGTGVGVQRSRDGYRQARARAVDFTRESNLPSFSWHECTRGRGLWGYEKRAGCAHSPRVKSTAWGRDAI